MAAPDTTLNLVGRGHSAYCSLASGSGPLWRAAIRSRCRIPSLALAPTSATATGGSDHRFHFFHASRPSILVVEDDAELRALTAFALKQAGHEAVLASSGEDAFDLMAAARLRWSLLRHRAPGPSHGWEVGTTFSFIQPSKLTVYGSAATTEPPGRLRNGIFLRKPFAMDWLVRVFEAGAIAARAKRQLA